jgi:pimeloyl-ACP methyl ester carboxylesterase
MKRLMLLAAAATLAANAQDVTGDWQGTLNVGAASLHLLVHISAASDGSLKATLDSLDQGANGIPISAIELKNSTLTFSSDALHAKYEGKVNAATIEGTFTQGQSFPLAFTRAVKASDIDGAWEGTLDMGQKLGIVFHFTTTKDGLAATADSPDQGAAGIPVSNVKRQGATLTLEIPQVGAKFQGTIAADLSSISGTFTQNGSPFPLVLKRPTGGKIGPIKRPQTPVKPYPYRAEDLKYPNPKAGIELAATLTLPPGKGPFPAVVLITGSGQQDRDETLLDHKPFLVLADALTRKGIAVLRSDDRGAGGSGGDFAVATTADFATDVEAAVAYLKTRPEVDVHRIGLAGHSEGGVIAPMVAARNRDIAFIVMLAGTGVPGDQIIVAQTVAGVEAEGASHEQALQTGAQERRILDLVEKEKDPAILKQKLAAETGMPPAQLDIVYRQLTSPWYLYFLSYDPAPALRKVSCPVLALNGSLDTQVPPKLNLPAIRQALQEGGNQHFEVVELPGLNHLFQHAKTGGFSEYARIEETMAPEVLEKIATWILAVPR